MWRDEKTSYLRKNRDYARLLDGDDADAQTPRSQNRGRGKDAKFEDEDDDVNRERQEYLDRRRRLKDLERQKLTKAKNGRLVNGIREELEVNNENRGHAGSSSRRDAAPALSKDKKKMPYDSSFGSFFGPSKPVVAKRIIEEDRARREAEIVATRDENASRKVERKKSVASSSAGKSSYENRPTQKPAKPLIQAKMVGNERARKLKEARDYSFLFDDSPLPEFKMGEAKGPVSSKIGRGGRQDSASVRATTNTTFRAPPLGQPKSTLGVRNPDRPSPSLLQSQSKSSQLLRPLPNQAPGDRYIVGKSTIQNKSTTIQVKSTVTSSAKPLSNKLSSTGPGRPDPRKDTEAMMRKLVAEGATSNGNKSTTKGRRPLSSPPVERLTSQNVDRRLSQHNSRPPVQPADRRPTQGTDRGLAQSTGRRPAQSTDRQPGESTRGRPAQLSDRRPVASQAAQRQHPVVTVKKTLVSGSFRPATGGEEPKREEPASQARRQSLQPKLAPKIASRPATSGHVRASYSDDPSQNKIRRKRARSLSEESDRLPVAGVSWTRKADPRNEEPAPKRGSRPVPSGVNRARHSKDSRQGEIRRPRAQSLSEESDDLPSDDDDSAEYHPSMIHKLMGYNPNKYRGNDDFDDRSMQVGFRAIQAEERRSAREARLEDERELALTEAEEKAERLRKAKKKGSRPSR